MLLDLVLVHGAVTIFNDTRPFVISPYNIAAGKKLRRIDASAATVS